MSQMRQRMTGGAPSPSGEATPGIGPDLANNPPAITGEGDQPPVFEGFQAFKQHTRVLGFSPKNKMLVLHIGAQQGLKPTMKLRLERNEHSHDLALLKLITNREFHFSPFCKAQNLRNGKPLPLYK